MQYSTRILGAVERDAQKHLWSEIQRDYLLHIYTNSTQKLRTY